MRKILSLGQKELASGLNVGGYYNAAGGLWAIAKGLNPFIPNDNFRGMLAGCSAPTDITGSVIVDNPRAAVSRVTGSNAGTLYVYGDSGHIYTIDLSANSAPVDLYTIASSANGLGIFKVASDEKLLYFQLTQIGRYDFASTKVDNWKTGLQSTAYHATHPFLDRLFFCNLYYVGYVYDNAGTMDANLTALDLPTDFTTTCLEDDGQYLVIGATKNKDTASSPAGIMAETKIIFWDTNSTSWQKEYTIPEASINALKRVGTAIHAICPGGEYVFNFNSEPEKIRELSNSDNVRYGFPNAIDRIGQGVIFGNLMMVSGKMAPYSSNGWWTPFFGGSMTGDVSLIYVNPRVNTMLIGTLGTKLYRFTVSTNGAPAQDWYTKAIDLGRRWKLQQIEFIFSDILVSGDQVSSYVLTEDNSSVIFDTASFTANGGVSRVKVIPTASARSPEIEFLRFVVDIATGTPSIKKINFWGEPVNQE